MRLEGRVLITGGAGFLARGFYQMADAEAWPVEFACLSRDDAKHAALQKRYPKVRCHLGDVASIDEDRLAWLFEGYDTVIHAAASKYVDRAETAAWDTMRTNVIGSANVLRAAAKAKVGRVVTISTDKAVAPVNTYGMTKALMERLTQEAASWGQPTEFVGVRYGNVVGSTGSVLPLFAGLADRGATIPLTDPRMTRFWMSITEAVECVLHALDPDETASGEIVVSAMRGMTMTDLVRSVLGFNEHGPLPSQGVEVVGTRPGEKRHEALLHKGEAIRTYRCPARYFHIMPPGTAPVGEPVGEITSDAAPGGDVGVAELRAMLAYAETV